MSKRMKCLSIRQPWTELILAGLKTLETRTWGTDYRGPLLLHAGRTLDQDAHAGFILATAKAGEQLPEKYGERINVRGSIVGVANLVDCRPSRPGDETWAMCEVDGKTIWVLESVRRFENPIGWKGALGLFEVPNGVVSRDISNLVKAWLEDMKGSPATMLKMDSGTVE